MKKIFIVMALFAALFAADGDLDPSFGSDGIAMAGSGSTSNGKAITIQSDGKIVMAGETWSGGPVDFALMRFNTDGALDSGFGNDGIVRTAVGSNFDVAHSVAIQSDGKIVAAGYSYCVFALVRYNADGTLDAGFGNGGIVKTANGNCARARSVAIQSDGKIIAAGMSEDYRPNLKTITLVRYNTDGTLDQNFGSTGIVRTAIEIEASAYSIAIQSDGKIVAAGYSQENYSPYQYTSALVRYNTDGTLDASFGSGGIVTTKIADKNTFVNSVKIQSDGKIVGAGYVSVVSDDLEEEDFALIRYNTDGTLDAGFGSSGIVTADIAGITWIEERAKSVGIQSDGKIVVSGYTSVEPYSTLVRYNTDGTLDTNFGISGIVRTDFSTPWGMTNSVAIQSDGKIVAGGDGGSHFILARYLASPIMPNTKPVAYAGADQAVILLNTAVQLDGNGSYDEDGDTISYDWNMTQKPAGSSAAISDPSSPTPTFIPDVYGDYVIELTVSDPTETGSTDSVTVSFDNVKPVANAGGNKSILVGDTAVLDGISSTDANGDPLTYSWSFVSKPAGSTATLSSSTNPTTSFVGDTNGTYDISLTVNDGLLDSDPNTASILSITIVNAITQVLDDAMDDINNIPPTALRNPNMANALTNKINAVLKMIEKEQYQGALNALTNDILTKTDGCTNGGDPDKDDWIKTCGEQDAVYSLIMEAISIVQRQL